MGDNHFVKTYSAIQEQIEKDHLELKEGLPYVRSSLRSLQPKDN